MALDRKIEMTVGADGTGTLISDLELEFEITRSITFAENVANFNIYNAKENTRKEVLRKGNNIIFKAGYADEGIGTLFIGNITEVQSGQQGSDWVTRVQAASIQSKEKPLDTVFVTLSYSPDTLLFRPLAQIGQALGLVVLGQENARINLENGFVYAGSTRGALDYCKEILKANGSDLYIDNTEIVIYNTDGRTSRFTPVYLDYDSGLISVEEVTETDNQSDKDLKKIQFQSLIIPKLQPNVLVNINTPRIKGFYLIEKLSFVGDNFGGDNTCSGEATA